MSAMHKVSNWEIRIIDRPQITFVISYYHEIVLFNNLICPLTILKCIVQVFLILN